MIYQDETYYVVPTIAAACSFPDTMDEILLAWKKDYYNDWQEFKKLVQQAHKEKYEQEVITIFKEQEAYNRKRYRALTYIIPYYFNKFPGDCKKIDQRKWPVDLANDIDAIFNRLVNLY